MATAQTIIDNARADMKIDPGKVIWTDSQLLRFVNEALAFLYERAEFKFEWKETTISPLVDGQAAYAYATDYRSLLWAKLVDGDAVSTGADESSLTIVTDTLGSFQQNRDMDYEGDQPGYIYEEDSKFKIWPIPNATAAARWTIKYKYSEFPTTLGLLDSPEFPGQWHNILEHYVRYRAWGSLPGPQNQASASNALGEWDGWSAKAVYDMLHRQDEFLTFRMPVLPTKPPR